MNLDYGLGFLLAASVTFALTPVVRKWAFRVGAVDQPGEARKIHNKPIARMGGVAIYLGFLVAVLLNFNISRELVGLLGGVTLLMVVGLVDDMRGLSPWVKLGWQVVAACLALAGGIGITGFTNPLGGFIHLDFWRFPVAIGPLHFHITPVANLFSLVWMVGMINVINFLDGLDGLACGISGIAAVIMFLLSIKPGVDQPAVALLAIILAGACAGFLPFNFFPAKIFMGDSGAYTLGLVLALLAIYSGAKLATAALVLGFTIVDGLWAVTRRLWHRTSPFKADRMHLHHLLLETGLSQRQAVLLLYVLALFFGLIALSSGSYQKLIVLVGLVLLMLSSLVFLSFVASRRRG